MTARVTVVRRQVDPPVLSRATEAQFQAQVLDVARLRGWWAYHPYDSRRSEPGWPDLTLVRDRVVFAELKTAKGRISKAQHEVHERLRAAGAEIHVWRPADIVRVANDYLR